MFEHEIVIDGKGHLKGRLASVVAHEILRGQNVTVVRCEEIVMTGRVYVNRLKYQDFRRKTRNANPRKGHIHYVSPSKIFWRTVRGMVPHKTARGTAAMGRLRVFEGVPHPYDERKKMVVPAALKVLRVKPSRQVTVLGPLAERVGWTKSGVVSRLEDKRKEKAQAYYEKKKQADTNRAKAFGNPEVKKIQDELARYGF